MPVYLVTGKLGSGKSLATVGRARDYLNQGRMVATNLDLNLEKMINPWAKNSKAIRLPDKPTLEDLENLPEPYEGDYDESKTGAIILDECGTWFNTREYRDKSRQPLINKLLHIRKAGWDVFFIIQHIEMIDKQVREGLGEHVVYCQRADRLGIPVLTPLMKLFGANVRPPKIHLAIVKYGTSTLSPVVDRWVYNGSDLYNAYDTRQVFGANDCGMYSYLPPYLTFGRYTSRKQVAKESYEKHKDKIKTFLSTGKRSFFLIGLTVGLVVNFFNGPEPKSAMAIEEVETLDSQPDELEEPEATQHILDGVRINAFILKSDGFEYYFKDSNLDPFYPESHGYKVRAINDCKAQLISIIDNHIITCRAMSPNAHARDVRQARANSD
jgi:hypothetical protein|tara:strand:- start:766 stop:1914 length:1149 start_codon:yes stop_codon:yes gene_type:complete